MKNTSICLSLKDVVPFRVKCTIPTLLKSKSVREKYVIVLLSEGAFENKRTYSQM